MSEDNKSALIFPAFAHDYPENPFGASRELEGIFSFFLKQASLHVDEDLASFDFSSNNFLDDEIKTQYITYIYSCSLSEYLKKSYSVRHSTAGYSMGFYSSLFHSGVMTFSDGLLLIRHAFYSMKKISGNRKFGMCSIIGLSREDIAGLIIENGLGAELTNQNSPFAFVLSGTLEEILFLSNAAKTEGALHTHIFKVNLPYHSSILGETEKDFCEFIRTIQFSAPSCKIISLIDQRLMDNPEDLKKEVVRNLFTPLNWYQTQMGLQELGVENFIECGFGNGLAKNSKFIEGSFRFFSALEYINYLEHKLNGSTVH